MVHALHCAWSDHSFRIICLLLQRIICGLELLLGLVDVLGLVDLDNKPDVKKGQHHPC